MKVCEHPDYDGQFPETFNWRLIDSVRLTMLASDLSRQILLELEQPPGNRAHVAGLRFALARIAGMSDV